MDTRPAAKLSPLARPPVEQAELVAEIAGSVAHNFNNVLTLIRGRAELLLGQLESGRLEPLQIQKGLQSIRTATIDAGELLKRLREVIRPPRELPATVFDLNDAVLDAEGLLQSHVSAVAEAKRIPLRLTACLTRGPALVSGQPSALREVLVNLILNAIDAMPAGGEVALETEREGASVVLRVVDTGVGMSEEILARAFTPFFTTKGPENMGLGLSSAQAIVRRHRGTITLGSRPGAGTTVTVTLPGAESPAASGAAPPASLPSGLRVLVVADEPAFAQVLVEFLTTHGSKVSVAYAGQSALAQLEQGRYDLVVTDLLLPDLSGREVARAARARAPDCVVILLSGGLVPTDDLQLDGAGVDRVLTKPADLPELLRVAAELLARRPGRQG